MVAAERDPMVLGPRRPQRGPRSVEHFVGSGPEDGGRLSFDILGVEEVDLPASSPPTFRQNLAVHDRVGLGLVGRAALDDDLVREVQGPGPQRYRHEGLGQLDGQLVQGAGCGPEGRRPDVRHHSGGGVVVEVFAVVVDRCRRHAGFDQLDPPAIHDYVVGRGGHRDSPAEVMGDP